MCFSAGASFGAGALLVGTGIFTIQKTESPDMRAFAGIPLLFGVQQLSEGILWMSSFHPAFAPWQTAAMYVFLFFALAVWSFWVPFSVWLMEPDLKRKKVLFYLMCLGGSLSLFFIFCFMTREASVDFSARHIKYHMDFPLVVLRNVFYFIVILAPIFISSLKLMKWVGGAVLLSLISTILFFYLYVLSVWCFFAAVISVCVLLVVIYNQKSEEVQRIPKSSLRTQAYSPFKKAG